MLVYYSLYIHTHLHYKCVVKTVNEDYIVLILKCLSGASLQLLAVCLLPTLFSIVAIPAKCKVTESTT